MFVKLDLIVRVFAACFLAHMLRLFFSQNGVSLDEISVFNIAIMCFSLSFVICGFPWKLAVGNREGEPRVAAGLVTIPCLYGHAPTPQIAMVCQVDLADDRIERLRKHIFSQRLTYLASQEVSLIDENLIDYIVPYIITIVAALMLDNFSHIEMNELAKYAALLISLISNMYFIGSVIANVKFIRRLNLRAQTEGA